MDIDKTIGLNYLTSDKAAADIRTSLDNFKPQLDAENARIADAVNEFGRKNTLEAAREDELEKALPSPEEITHVRDMLNQGISPEDIPDSVAKDANILNGGQFANKYSEGMLKKISGIFERQYVDDIAQRDLINSNTPLQNIKDLGVHAASSLADVPIDLAQAVNISAPPHQILNSLGYDDPVSTALNGLSKAKDYLANAALSPAEQEKQARDAANKAAYEEGNNNNLNRLYGDDFSARKGLASIGRGIMHGIKEGISPENLPTSTANLIGSLAGFATGEGLVSGGVKLAGKLLPETTAKYAGGLTKLFADNPEAYSKLVTGLTAIGAGAGSSYNTELDKSGNQNAANAAAALGAVANIPFVPFANKALGRELTPNTPLNAVKSIVKSSAELAAVNGGSTLGSNIADKYVAGNDKTNITDGVGESIGDGIVNGAIPGLVHNAPMLATGALVGGAKGGKLVAPVAKSAWEATKYVGNKAKPVVASAGEASKYLYNKAKDATNSSIIPSAKEAGSYLKNKFTSSDKDKDKGKFNNLDEFIKDNLSTTPTNTEENIPDNLKENSSKTAPSAEDLNNLGTKDVKDTSKKKEKNEVDNAPSEPVDINNEVKDNTPNTPTNTDINTSGSDANNTDEDKAKAEAEAEHAQNVATFKKITKILYVDGKDLEGEDYLSTQEDHSHIQNTADQEELNKIKDTSNNYKDYAVNLKKALGDNKFQSDEAKEKAINSINGFINAAEYASTLGSSLDISTEAKQSAYNYHKAALNYFGNIELKPNEHINEANVGSISERDNVENTVATAYTKPEEINSIAADSEKSNKFINNTKTILKHIDFSDENFSYDKDKASKLGLTDKDVLALKAAHELIHSISDEDTNINNSNTNKVDRNVRDTSNIGFKQHLIPLTQHFNDIIKSIKESNDTDTKANILSLKYFAQHLQNKVKAINLNLKNKLGGISDTADRETRLKALEANNSTNYINLNPMTRKWDERSTNNINIVPHKDDSRELALTIKREADIATNLYNTFSKFKPELGFKEMENTDLHPALETSPREAFEKPESLSNPKIEEGTKEYRDMYVPKHPDFQEELNNLTNTNSDKPKAEASEMDARSVATNESEKPEGFEENKDKQTNNKQLELNFEAKDNTSNKDTKASGSKVDEPKDNKEVNTNKPEQLELDFNKDKSEDTSKVILTGNSPYLEKDQAKANKANKFIGYGAEGSSTKEYSQNFGDKANTGKYIKDDKVFVSVNGKRRNRVTIENTEFKDQLKKATDAGATIIADNEEARTRKHNIGERDLVKYLEGKGYKETENGNGIWKPKEDNTNDVKSNKSLLKSINNGIDKTVSNTKISNTDKIKLLDRANKAVSNAKGKELSNEDYDKLTKKITAEKSKLNPMDNKTKGIPYLHEPKTNKSDIKDVYGNLASDTFTNTYKFNDDNLSRTSNEEAPVDSVVNTLNDKDKVDALNLNKAVKTMVSKQDTKDNYSNFIKESFKAISEKLDEAISKFLEKNKVDLDKNYANQAIFNLFDKGTNKLNDTIKGNGILALQQFISNPHMLMGTLKTDDSSLLNSIGVTVTDTSKQTALIYDINSKGVNDNALTMALGSKIRDYLNIRGNDNISEGRIRSYTEALAAELISAAVKAGYLTKTDMLISSTGDILEKPKGIQGTDHAKLTLIGSSKEDSHQDLLNKLDVPDLIEHLVSTKPELSIYVGVIPTDSSRRNTQLHSDVPLTKTQKVVSDKIAKTIYNLNPFSKALYNHLGLATLMDLFGGGSKIANKDDESRAYYNKNHLGSLDGKNALITATWSMLNKYNKYINAYAEAEGLNPEDVPVYFNNDYTKVNRNQFFGAQNVQANKLMREFLLPTRHYIDLSDETSDNFDLFKRSILQAAGYKVEGMNQEQLNSSFEKFNNDYSDLIKTLREYNSKNFEISPKEKLTLEEHIRNMDELTPVAINMINEYSRYLNTKETNKDNLKNFQTIAKIEQDGINNGSAGSIMLLGTGEIEPKDLDNLSGVGIFIGKDTNLIESRQIQPNDLYATSAISFNAKVDNALTNFGDKTGMYNTVDGIKNLLGKYVKGFNLEGNDTELLKLLADRNALKNPQTVTTYCSGAHGIAQNIVGEITSGIYEDMSKILKATKDKRYGMSDVGKILHDNPDEKLTDDEYAVIGNEWVNNINNLFGVKLTRKGYMRDNGTPFNFIRDNLREYTFTDKHFNNATNVIRDSIVEPIRDSIEEVLGTTVLNNINTLMRLGQVHGGLIQGAYKALLENSKELPQDRIYGLSKEGKRTIANAIQFLYPVINEADQNSSFLNRTKYNPNVDDKVGDNYIAKSLDSSIKSRGSMGIPSTLGVGHVPSLIIAHNDGAMINNYVEPLKRPLRELPVFDGVELPLDLVKDASVGLNKAVSDAYLVNILEGWSKNFDDVVNNLDIDKVIDNIFDGELNSNNRELRKNLALALESSKVFIIDSTGGRFPSSPSAIKDEMVSHFTEEDKQEIKENLLSFNNEVKALRDAIQAKINVLKNSKYSIEQMASVGMRFLHEGNELGKTNEEIADNYNKQYNEELDYLSNKDTTNTVGSKSKRNPISNALNKLGISKEEGGYYNLNREQLSNLRDHLDYTPEQKEIFDMVNHNLIKDDSNDLSVITGTRSNLLNYVENNTNLDEDTKKSLVENIKGNNLAFYDHNLNKIFLNYDGRNKGYKDTRYDFNPHTVLLHEMVHAVTSKAIDAYVSDISKEIDPDTVLPLRKAGVFEALRNIDILSSELARNITDENSALVKQLNLIKDQKVKNWFDGLSKLYKNYGDDTYVRMAETLAYVLSSKELGETLKKTNVDGVVNKEKYPYFTKVAKLFNSAKEFIKRLFGFEPKKPSLLDNFYEELKFNAANVMDYQNTALKGLSFGALDGIIKDIPNHTVDYAVSDPLEGERIDNTQAKFFEAFSNIRHDASMKDTRDVKDQVLVNQLKTNRIAMETVNKLIANGFSMNKQQETLFRTVMLSLSSRYSNTPNVLAKLSNYYSHVIDNIDPNTFTKYGDTKDISNKKYISLLGSPEKDFFNKNTQLAAFLGLALTDESFRKVLADIPAPRSKTQINKQYTGMDKILTDFGNKFNDYLSDKQTGTSKYNNTNMSKVLDVLGDNIADVIKSDQSYKDLYETPLGKFMDTVNAKTSDFIKSIANKGASIAKSFNNKHLTAYSELLSKLTDEDRSKALSMSFQSLINKSNLFHPVKDLLTDMVGRTDDNKDIYDMINSVGTVLQKTRQEFREKTPRVIANLFNNELKSSDWDSLYHGIAKTDVRTLEPDKVIEYIKDSKSLDKDISSLEANFSKDVINKSKQLANFMNTGKYGNYLLRNADIIAKTYGYEGKENEIDKLISMYSLSSLDQVHKDTLKRLVDKYHTKGNSPFHTLISYTKSLTEEELNKSNTEMGRYNYYKGFAHTEAQQGMSLVLADKDNIGKLEELSHTSLGQYVGSPLDNDTELKKSKYQYMFAPVNTKSSYSAGIMQNVRETANGINPNTGGTLYRPNLGYIRDAKEVNKITRNILSDKNTSEPLSPIFNSKGQIVAYERTLDTDRINSLNFNTNLKDMLGAWRGRQVEEHYAHETNKLLVDKLFNKYNEDTANSDPLERQKEYINILGSDIKDPILRDSISMLSNDVKAYMDKLTRTDEKADPVFYVRKDMLDDVFGYRNPSVGDIWTGTSRWNPKVLEAAKTVAMKVFGNKAYMYALNAEKIIGNFFTNNKVSIVVKSMVVPLRNILANVKQLVIRGVPIKNIITQTPKKIDELNQYLKLQNEYINLQLEQNSNPKDSYKYKATIAKIKSIKSTQDKLSIAPLIKAGELGVISEINPDDLKLTDNDKLDEYFNNLVNKLPKPVLDAGRYAVISRDTALFSGLQKTVEYGDFIAKALYFDYLVQGKNLTQEEALGKVSEEYVNFARLRGRFRTYTDMIGLTNFFNTKVRSSKVALSILQDNPFNALTLGITPFDVCGQSVGSPLDDNILSQSIDFMGTGNLHGAGWEHALDGRNIVPLSRFV